MKKKIIIISIILIIILSVSLLVLFLYKSKKAKYKLDDSTCIYDKNGQVISNFSEKDEIVETEENVSIQGIV